MTEQKETKEQSKEVPKETEKTEEVKETKEVEAVKEVKEKPKRDLGNSILISNKPIGNYISAARQVIESNDELVIKARGKTINTAVNVAEIMKREGLKVKSIVTGTEKFTKDNREITVSSIDLILTK